MGSMPVTQETYIVGYEGKDRDVVDFAADRARRNGARLHIVHVLEWSPYSFLTPQELEERHKRREKELSRASEAVLDPIVSELKANGLEVDGTVRHGAPADVLIDIAKNSDNGSIFVGRSGHSSIAARILGSVTIGLVQASPVPVVVVP